MSAVRRQKSQKAAKRPDVAKAVRGLMLAMRGMTRTLHLQTKAIHALRADIKAMRQVPIIHPPVEDAEREIAELMGI